MLQFHQIPITFFMFLLIGLGFGLSACQQTNQIVHRKAEVPKLTIATAKVYVAVGIENYPNETYAIYLPSTYDLKKTYPLYIFCDPQGSAAYPIAKYQSLAESYQAILVGSNNCKNGIDLNTCISYLEHIVEECKMKYAINDSFLNVCGFSGGAKVAGAYAAMHSEVHSLVGGGAMPTLEQCPQKMPILVFAGNRDMNFTDLVNFQTHAKASESLYDVTLLEFDGKHEWPDSITYEYAFVMNEQVYSGTSNALRFIEKMESKKYNGVVAQINAYQAAIHLLGNRVDAKKLQRFVDEASSKPETKVLVAQKAAQVKVEQGLKDYYNKLIGQKDLIWWTSEREKLMHPENEADLDMCTRVLGFLSLAGYSYSNRYTNQNDFKNATQMLDFYRAVDPQNSDQPYLSAIMYSKMGDKVKAISSLNQAIKMGFNNKSKLLGETAFQPLVNDVDFKKVIALLK